jgi:hypothetical protein
LKVEMFEDVVLGSEGPLAAGPDSCLRGRDSGSGVDRAGAGRLLAEGEEGRRVVRERGDGEIYLAGEGRRTWMLRYRAVVNGKVVRIKESSGTTDRRAAERILKAKLGRGGRRPGDGCRGRDSVAAEGDREAVS